MLLLRPFRLFAVRVVMLAAALLAAPLHAHAAESDATPDTLATFEITEHLGHDFTDELVFFDVNPALFDIDHLQLVDSRDRPLAHQWVRGPQPRIAFLADLPANTTATWRLTRNAAAPTTTTDLQVRTQTHFVEVTSAHTGVRFARGDRALTQGPIAGVRLPGDQWVGQGAMVVDEPAVEHEVRVVERGPVFVDVEATYQFLNEGMWTVRARVIRGQPIVLIDETFTNDNPAAAWRFSLGARFRPDRLYHRPTDRTAIDRLDAIEGERVYLLEPWLRWWGGRYRGRWAAFYRGDTQATAAEQAAAEAQAALRDAGDLIVDEEEEDDQRAGDGSGAPGASDAAGVAVDTVSAQDEGPALLAVAARHAAAWREPGVTNWPTAIPILREGVALQLQLRGPARRWMFITLPADVDSLATPQADPPVQAHVIRHSDLPLQQIREMTLSWNDAGRVDYPRLFITEDELAAFRGSFVPDPAEVEQLLAQPVGFNRFDVFVQHAIAGDNEALKRKVVEQALANLRSAVDLYTKQLAYNGRRVSPREYNVISQAINLLDAALGSGVMTGDEVGRARAQLAFLGYVLADPSVWSPAHGHAANPNMTTTARTALGLIACLIPEHPQAAGWARLAVDEVGRELLEWSGRDGGWLEAPHYMTVSIDGILSLAVALRRTTFSEVAWTTHPRLKAAMLWLAAISTPPDPRLEGRRRMPEIGNTYLGETTCLPGWAAHLFADTDPEFSKHMQWMWQQQGSPRRPGLGGLYPGVAGWQWLLLDEDLPAAAPGPGWGSMLFRDTGAVFRAHFPSDRETYLHYIQGPMHQHYDYDEGSIIFWGKGSPLCEDFGYYGRAPASDHSRVDDGVKEYLGSEGRIESFLRKGRLGGAGAPGAPGGPGTPGDPGGPAAGADYLRGRRAGWHRQILFVRDDEPLGSNYVVLSDTLDHDHDAVWRLYLATDEAPDLTRNPIRVRGRWDVDLVIYFATPVADDVLSTQRVERTVGASGFDSRSAAQYALELDMADQRTVQAVLFPVLRDEATPDFSAADGLITIDTSAGPHTLFVAATPATHTLGGEQVTAHAGVHRDADQQPTTLIFEEEEGRTR